MSREEVIFAAGVAAFLIGLFVNPVLCVAGALLLIVAELGRRP